MLLHISLDVLLLILDCVSDHGDIWSLYNTCTALRFWVSSRLKFTLDISFESTVPCTLNGHELPPAEITRILKDWSGHIQDLGFNCWEVLSRPTALEFLRQLPLLERICPRIACSQVVKPKHFTEAYYRGLYVGGNICEENSLRSWNQLQELVIEDSCVDILALPGLPALRLLTVDFYHGPWRVSSKHYSLVAVHLEKLPRLSRLNVCFLEADNLILLGKSKSLKYLSLTCSDVEERFQSSIIRLAPELEAFEAKDCTIKSTANSNAFLSQLKSIELEDSICYLPFLFSEEIPDSLETVSLTTGEEDKRQMEQAGLDLSVFLPEDSDVIKITNREASVTAIRKLVQALKLR